MSIVQDKEEKLRDRLRKERARKDKDKARRRKGREDSYSGTDTALATGILYLYNGYSPTTLPYTTAQVRPLLPPRVTRVAATVIVAARLVRRRTGGNVTAGLGLDL